VTLDWTEFGRAAARDRSGSPVRTASRDGAVKRAGWAADELEYVEIRSPEGRVHRVPFGSSQLRIPELDCDDHLSVRYVGTRSFREQLVRVGEHSTVKLPNPSMMHTDDFTLAGAIGGGWRYQDGAGRLDWGPQAELMAILVWRGWRGGSRPSVGFHFEFRASAILAAQPYCARLVATKDDESESCEAEDWSRTSYWRFPLQVGPNLQLGRSVTAGFAVGFAPTFYHLANDSGRLNRPVLGALRAHLGYKLTRGISVEPYLRAFWGEEVRKTLFDVAGVREAGESQDVSSWSLFPGALIRADDIL
jgi:hypothetical protein